MVDENRIGGTLTIELRAPGGEVALRRRARNTVVRGGAEVVAGLFAGTLTTPVNGMAVGTNAQPLAPPYDLKGLAVVDETGQALSGPTAVAIAASDVQVTTLASEMRVLVSVRGVLPKEAALAHDGGTSFVSEAALGVLAPDGKSLARIYNRVIFDPVPKGKEHELALYWEISFPYGV
jgi:hypothetical protein